MSPDGKSVLFVSNYLGNLDLFRADPALRRAEHIRIGTLNFRTSMRSVQIRVRNEAGSIMPSRVSVRASDGKYYSPPGSMARYHPGMGDSSGFFHSTGSFDLSIPAGPFRVAAFRGLEYQPAISESGSDTVVLTLKKVSHWQGNGWWSGEDHIHANYAGPYYLRPEDSRLMVEAEDLNVANFLVANAEGRRMYDKEFFQGKPHPLSNSAHLMYWNQEYRNRIVYGHMALLNLKRLLDPSYTSFLGTPQPYDYPSNSMVAAQAKQMGAIVAYVHPIVGATRDPFDFTVSAKELPVTAALGLVDVVDIYPWGPVAAEIWYTLLNCGFRIAPGAGTDTFSNWRSLNQVPGNSRVFVRSTGPLTYEDWAKGLKRGDSFVTNGPMLTLSVSGKVPGETVSLPESGHMALSVKVRAESRVALRKLELLLNGKVVATQSSPGGSEITLEWKGDVAEDGWFAARCEGEPEARSLGAPAQAHTAAVYLRHGSKPMQPLRNDAELFVTWIDRLWDLIELRNNFASTSQKETVRTLVQKARKYYAAAVK